MQQQQQQHRGEPQADQRNVVAVVLDVCGVRRRGIEAAVVAAVSAFCRALLVMDPASEVALLAAYPAHVSFLFRTSGTSGDASRAQVGRSINAALAALPSAVACTTPPLASALSRALCYIHRHCSTTTTTSSSSSSNSPSNARVVCVQASPDDRGQYVALMNVAFAAQREGVPVDALVLAPEHSSLLQQAAHITKGIYLKPGPFQNAEALLQTMLVRGYLSLFGAGCPSLSPSSSFTYCRYKHHLSVHLRRACMQGHC